MKIINVLIISLLIGNLFGQNLTVIETVNYINKKLKENPVGFDVYQIEVTPDGYLTTYYNSYYNGSCELTIKKFLIRNASVDYESTGLVYPQSTIGFSGMKTVKEGEGDCNSRNIQLTDNSSYYSPYVKFSNDEIIHQSLFNAFTHLFELVKSNPDFSQKSDPNDPFSPGNYNKTSQSNKSIGETNTTSSNPQIPCNIQTTNRLDGTTVKYIKPDLVGLGNNCELGLGIQTNGQDFFLVTYVRYFNQAKKIIGNLGIKLLNGQSIELRLYKSELSTIQNENIGTSIFILKDSDINILKDSWIKVAVFQESNNINQIIPLNQNFDILERQLNCFGK